MVRIIQSGIYQKNLRKLLSRDVTLVDSIVEHVDWFKNNPEDTRLLNHPLHKTMEGQWAFSITDDIRIVYEWVGKKTVRFLAIGGHVEVYLLRGSSRQARL